jgi:hypothetical protein
MGALPVSGSIAPAAGTPSRIVRVTPPLRKASAARVIARQALRRSARLRHGVRREDLARSSR